MILIPLCHSSLLVTAYKKALKFEDLPGLMEADKSKNLVPLFEDEWENQMKKRKG